MDSRKTWAIIHRTYDNVHAALWAALLVFVLYFAVFVAPKLPEARARAESQRILEISTESRFYCKKWKMLEGTHENAQCRLDLQEIRAKVEQRIADDIDF
jgi:hypothetical protein